MKITFPNQDGTELAGRLELPSSRPKSFALFAHCFTCSKDVIAANVISKALTNHGIGVLRFDFTGLGNSQGDFSNTNFSSNVDDLLAACAFLGKEYQHPELLIGHSLGGAAVLKAATKLESVKAVATIGAPSSVGHVSHLLQSNLSQIEKEGQADVDLAGRKFTIKKQFIDDINDVDLLEGVKTFKKALLVLHSPIDNTVGIENASAIFTAAMHPKSFVTLDNADHLLMKREDAAYAAEVIGAWVNRYVSKEQDETFSIQEGTVLVKSRLDSKFTHDIYTEKHHIVADEPPSVKGDDLGMNPYELLLSSLGACTAMTLKMYANHKGLQLDEVAVKLRHEKVHAEDCNDCETKTGKVDVIHKNITVKGPLTPEQKQRLYEIAEKCPVNRTLMSEIKIVPTHDD
jgi:putative redox protein